MYRDIPYIFHLKNEHKFDIIEMKNEHKFEKKKGYNGNKQGLYSD